MKCFNTPAIGDRACGRGAPAWPRRAAASFNKVTPANAGWRTQFRIRGSRHQPGVAEFYR